MTATSHVATGSVLLALAPNLWLLPVAILLHFALDALPHYGDIDNPARSMGRLRFLLPVDASCALLALGWIYIVHPLHWSLILAGGVLCAAPDLLQFPGYMKFLNTHQVPVAQDWLARFHGRIQRFERPWGIWFEAPWLACMLMLLWKYMG